MLMDQNQQSVIYYSVNKHKTVSEHKLRSLMCLIFIEYFFLKLNPLFPMTVLLMAIIYDKAAQEKAKWHLHLENYSSTFHSGILEIANWIYYGANDLFSQLSKSGSTDEKIRVTLELSRDKFSWMGFLGLGDLSLHSRSSKTSLIFTIQVPVKVKPKASNWL